MLRTPRSAIILPASFHLTASFTGRCRLSAGTNLSGTDSAAATHTINQYAAISENGADAFVPQFDQGSQNTSGDWKEAILEKNIKISMDGKGGWGDNIIMERFWRIYKHEFFLHREPKSLEDAIEMTFEWMEYYNRERPHSALKNCSPLMYRENLASPLPENFWRDFSAPARLASLRSAPSLRSGRRAYASKSRQKWIDIRGYRMI